MFTKWFCQPGLISPKYTFFVYMYISSDSMREHRSSTHAHNKDSTCARYLYIVYTYGWRLDQISLNETFKLDYVNTHSLTTSAGTTANEIAEFETMPVLILTLALCLTVQNLINCKVHLSSALSLKLQVTLKHSCTGTCKRENTSLKTVVCLYFCVFWGMNTQIFVLKHILV